MIPRWLRVLETLLLPPADREFLEGDLREEYARRRRDRGAASAAALYLLDLFNARRARASALRAAGLDLAYSARVLRRRPVFAVAAITTLALGIGATTALFSVADAVLLTPLPYTDPDRLLFVSSSFPGATGGGDQLAYLEIREIAERSATLDAIGAYHTGRALQLRSAAEPERVRANFVDAAYLRILGAATSRGRVFQDEEGRTPGAHPVVVLSHQFWTNRLGANPDIVGRQLILSDVSLTVIGVLEAGFRDVSAEEGYSFDSDVFVPVMMIGAFGGGDLLTGRTARNFWALGRVAPGATVSQAKAEIAAIGEHLQRELPGSNRGFTFWGEQLDAHLAREIRGPVLLLLGGSLFVLLIACANVANLLLAHVSSQMREFSVRRAIGASRFQVIRLLFAQAAVLAAAGGAVGLLLTFFVQDLVGMLVPGELTPRLAAAGVNGRVLAVSILITAGVAGALALLAALRLGGNAHLNPLRDGTRSTEVRGSRTRRILLGLEVATAVILLVGAQLMLGSLTRLRSADLGFRADRLVTLQMDLRAQRYNEQAAVARFGQELVEALAAAPGVESATLWGPGRPGRNTWITFPGREDAPVTAERMMTWRHTITPGALAHLGIPLIAGREFDARDSAGTPFVAIVSQTLARTLWPGEEPLGKRLKWRTDVPNSPLLSVVGVAGDASHRGRLERLLYPARDIYVPQAQRHDRTIVAVVRASDDTDHAVQAARAIVRRLDPDLPLFDVRTMAGHLAAEEAETRFAAVLMATYAVVALLLSAVGIYGVLSYHVSLRRRELAVRSALGAQRADLLRLVVLDGVKPAAFGIVLGLAAAVALARMLRGLLFEVQPTDPAVFLTVALLITLVTLAATLMPAVGATRAADVEALRGD